MTQDHHSSALRASNDQHPASQLVHQLVQFVRVVRHRKGVLVVAVGISALLGGLHLLTATRFYQSKASLLVMQTGNDVMTTAMTPDRGAAGLMPTYQRLLSSAPVLDGALKYIAPEHRIDLSQNREAAANALRAGLTVSTLKETSIFEIGFRSKSPDAAVAVVNAVVRSYLEFMEKTHQGTAAEILDVLTHEKAELDIKVAAKENEVATIRIRFGDLGIASAGKVLHPLIQRVLTLDQEASAAEKKVFQLRSSLASIENAMQKGEDLEHFLMGMEDVLGHGVLASLLGSDTSTQAYVKSLLDDRVALETLSEYYGPAHPRVTQLANRIRAGEQYQAQNHVRPGELGPTVTQLIQKRLIETEQHERSLQVALQQARAEASGLNGDMVQLELGEQQLKWLRGLRDAVLNQIASVDLKRDQGSIRTAIVNEPTVNASPISPKWQLVVVVCVLGGLAAGISVIYVLDVMDDRFRSPEELRTQLGVPLLGMVRRLDNLAEFGLGALQVHAAPEAVGSEAFRTLRTALTFAARETQRIVISSTEPGDGKTTVLANLAVAYAQAGKKTLLIDADLRRPGLTSLLQLKKSNGLSDVLRRHEPVAELASAHVQPSGIEGLDVLPSGPRMPNPGEVLSGARFVDLLAWAETNYDQVLIDSPPALVASDSAVIARAVDGVILVVRPDKNQRRAVLHAAESLSALGATVCGLVINRLTLENDQAYYGYGVGYSYSYGEDQTEMDDANPSTPTDEGVIALASTPKSAETSAQAPRRRAA